MRKNTPAGTRGGIALLAVLVVVTIGAMIGTSLLYSAEAGRESAAASLRAEQSRLLAWSGVQAVMSELASQREDLLAGEPPRVTSAWIFGDDEGGGAGEGGPRFAYRLVANGEADLVSEPGKLDVNHASAEMLAKIPGLGEALAADVIAKRPYASLHELLRVDTISETMLFGSAGETGGQAAAGGEEFPGVSGADGQGRLADLLTVFSFDPNVQCGIGERGAEAAGERRLNLNTEWTDELGEAVERRLGPEAAGALKGAMTSGTTFATDADVIVQLRALGVPADDWAEILDVFTTSDAEYVLGRVDLLTASATVLACIPGIDEEAAARIEDRRGKIEPELRRSVAWPVVDGILTPEQFTEAAPYLMVRAMQWRIVVEAGRVATGPGDAGGDDTGLPPIGGPRGGAGSAGDLSAGAADELPEGAVLEDRVVLEAVIDVSSRRPRVAYLRDVTLLPLAQVMKRRAMAADSRREREPEPDVSERDLPLPVEPTLAPDNAAASTSGPLATSPSSPPPSTPTPLPPSPPLPAGPPLAVEPAPAGTEPADGRIGRWTTRSGSPSGDQE